MRGCRIIVLRGANVVPLTDGGTVAIVLPSRAMPDVAIAGNAARPLPRVVGGMSSPNTRGLVVDQASQASYRPESLDDLVDFIVQKILDRLGVKADLIRRWGGSA